MEMMEIMRRRRSHRDFSEESLTEDEIKELERAALCAPTSKNCHSCRFVFVTDKEKIAALSKAKESGAGFLEKAPLAIVVAADATLTDVWVEDASIAATFIQLEAEALGLGSCWAQMHLRGFADGRRASDIVKKELGMDEKLEVLCVIGVGRKVKERSSYTDERLMWDLVSRQ